MFYGLRGDCHVRGVWGSGRGLVVVVLSWSCVIGAGGGILGDVYWVGALGIGINVNAGVAGAFLVYGIV